MNLAESLAMADEAIKGVEVGDGDFKPVTPGIYDVQITACTDKQSKSTNPNNPAEHGMYLEIECTITGPSFVGRKLWMNNNITVFPKSLSSEDVARSQKAMAIGARERKVMLDSIGKTGIEVAQELVGASFKANVVIRPADGKYEARNEIKSIKPIDGKASAPAASTQVATSAPATAPAAAHKKMPWEK